MADAKSETKAEQKKFYLDNNHTFTIENDIDEENFRIGPSFINKKKAEKKKFSLDFNHMLTIENDVDEENFRIVQSYINLKTNEVEQKIKNEESEKKCYLLHSDVHNHRQVFPTYFIVPRHFFIYLCIGVILSLWFMHFLM